MEILIRKEPNGTIYLDKKSVSYFEILNMSEPPYNFIKIQIDDKYADCTSIDFDDNLKFNVEKYNARKNAIKLEELRNAREIICFTIINRGKLWYDKLTKSQLNELNIWYHEWLDVTQTKQIPKKPSWIK